MERVYSTGSITASNASDILVNIRDVAAPILGWEVWDDRIATAQETLVLKSTGYPQNNGRLPCYIGFTNLWDGYIVADLYVYWDKVNHNGYNKINYPSGSYIFRMASVYCDQTTYNNINLKGNKDYIMLEVFRPSTSTTSAVHVFRIDNPIWNYIGEWQSTTYAGNNVVVQLGENEASQFKAGAPYRIVSPEGYITKATANVVNRVSDTITFDTIPYTLVSGTLMGSCTYPWISYGEAPGVAGYTPCSLSWNFVSSYAIHNPGVGSWIPGGSDIVTAKAVSTQTNAIDVYNNSDIGLVPIMFLELGAGVWGYSSYLYYLNYGVAGDITGVNELLTGSVTTSTVTSITDTNQNFNADSLIGLGLIITSGEQDEVIRYITDNTDTTIYFDDPLSTTVSGGETYAVCEAFYKRIGYPNTIPLAFKII